MKLWGDERESGNRSGGVTVGDLRAGRRRIAMMLALSVWVGSWEAWRLVQAAEAGPGPAPRVLERGPHHRVVAAGGAVYTELAAGMHYFEGGEWRESQPEFEIVDGTAVTRRGPHELKLPANLNAAGAVTWLDRQRRRFRSHLLGLAYTDAATGRSVLIASLQDCRGAIVPPNQVVYEGALGGDCEADVRFTCTRRGVEQDIILRSTLPSPAEWGFDPNTTRLEVFTEFVELPARPRRTRVLIRPESNRSRAARMVEPDLVDELLDFRGFNFGPGLAFPLAAVPGPERTRLGVPSGKSLETIGGRTFLIEKIDYRSLQPFLSTLPRAARAESPAEPGQARVLQARTLPEPPGGNAGRWPQARYAAIDSSRASRMSRPGLVLDYLAFAEGLTDWRFRSDMTYLVSDLVDLHGTTVLEGTVIKFAPGGTIQIWGPMDCQTGVYQPAILTAWDDHSVGAPVGPGAGPRGFYAEAAVAFKGAPRRETVRHLTVRHAGVAVALDPEIRLELSHAQISRCRWGVLSAAGADVRFRNVLVDQLDTAFFGLDGAGIVRGEHGTFHRLHQLLSDSAPAAQLTNCLIAAVTNNLRFAGVCVERVVADAGLFERSGGGAHYLPARSPHRDAGTWGIDSALRREMAELTTEAPWRPGPGFLPETELRPRVLRDRNQPDLGYHYPAVDYLWASQTLSGRRLTVAPGTAIGFESVGSRPGLTMEAGAQWFAEGRPDQMIRLILAAVVQDEPASARGEPGWGPQFVWLAPPGGPDGNFRWRFVESVLPGGVGTHVSGDSEWPHAPLSFRDCQLVGGRWTAGKLAWAFTNCVLDRVYLEVESSDDELPRHFHQNLFRSGTVQIDLPTSTQVHARNNFFAQTRLRGTATWHHSHNGYLLGGDRLPGSSVGNRVLREANFQPGPLGRFYYPSQGGAETLAALRDAGSAEADRLGLAHYTTRTDQQPEGITRADIGFHYVAVDPKARPSDRDGDGRPDYGEDADGDGRAGASESNWLVYDSEFGLGGSLALEIFTPLE